MNAPIQPLCSIRAAVALYGDYWRDAFPVSDSVFGHAMLANLSTERTSDFFEYLATAVRFVDRQWLFLYCFSRSWWASSHSGYVGAQRFDRAPLAVSTQSRDPLTPTERVAVCFWEQAEYYGMHWYDVSAMYAGASLYAAALGDVEAESDFDLLAQIAEGRVYADA